jgi:hypothetical protein
MKRFVFGIFAILLYIGGFHQAGYAKNADERKQYVIKYIIRNRGDKNESGDSGTEMINGMDTYHLKYFYKEDSCGTALCTAIVVNAGGIFSIVTVDVVESAYPEYKDIIAGIVNRLKKIQ